MPHERFKKLVEQSKAVVRTAEFRPYSNVLLYSGVAGLFEGSAGQQAAERR
ncbi:MAG: RbsD/FucU domain-containing protein [Clostridia bacterium]